MDLNQLRVATNELVTRGISRDGKLIKAKGERPVSEADLVSVLEGLGAQQWFMCRWYLKPSLSKTVPHQCESGSSMAPRHEACGWVLVWPRGRD